MVRLDPSRDEDHAGELKIGHELELDQEALLALRVKQNSYIFSIHILSYPPICGVAFPQFGVAVSVVRP